MGLESHIEQVLTDEGTYKSGADYYFYDGMVVVGRTIWHRRVVAEELMRILNESGQFAPTYFDEKTGKIRFDNRRKPLVEADL